MSADDGSLSVTSRVSGARRPQGARWAQGARRPQGARFLVQIAAAVDTVRINSSGGFTFLGTRYLVGSSRERATTSRAMARRQLCDAIADRLYAGFFVTGGVRPVPTTGSGISIKGAQERVASSWPDDGLVRALSNANAGRGPWIPGWRMRGSGPYGDPIVERGGLSVVAPASACRAAASGIGAAREMEVRYPKELVGPSPGFYVALGDIPIPLDGAVLRVYWNLRPSGAARFVGMATRSLNRLQLPFELKVPHHSDGFGRRDAGILYLSREAFPTALAALRSMHGELLPHLRAGVPALTRPLARGVSLAEDPPGGDSFGTSRCGLLAAGIVRAHERRACRRDERLAEVLDVFREEGVDPRRPYLNPDSTFEPAWLDAGDARAGP